MCPDGLNRTKQQCGCFNLFCNVWVCVYVGVWVCVGVWAL